METDMDVEEGDESMEVGVSTASEHVEEVKDDVGETNSQPIELRWDRHHPVQRYRQVSNIPPTTFVIKYCDPHWRSPLSFAEGTNTPVRNSKPSKTTTTTTTTAISKKKTISLSCISQESLSLEQRETMNSMLTTSSNDSLGTRTRRYQLEIRPILEEQQHAMKLLLSVPNTMTDMMEDATASIIPSSVYSCSYTFASTKGNEKQQKENDPSTGTNGNTDDSFPSSQDGYFKVGLDSYFASNLVQDYKWNESNNLTTNESACNSTSQSDAVATTSVSTSGIAVRSATRNNDEGDNAPIQDDDPLVGTFMWLSPELRKASNDEMDDYNRVWNAVRWNGHSLKYASEKLRNNKEIVHAATQSNPLALQWASDELKNDFDVAWDAVKRNGLALQFVSDNLRSCKDIVQLAVRNDARALQYARDGLNQDPDCWLSAQLWMIEDLIRKNSSTALIVLSTRFSLLEDSNSSATSFTYLLNQDCYIRNGNFKIFAPNAFNKSTCDPEWTRMDWPCRGTYETCQMDPTCKGTVPNDTSCWRYSFRYHLEQAQRTGGFMIQVVDYDDDSKKHVLGKGQEIETIMAWDVGTKVCRICQPIQNSCGVNYSPYHAYQLCDRIRTWYAYHRSNSYGHEIQFHSKKYGFWKTYDRRLVTPDLHVVCPIEATEVGLEQPSHSHPESNSVGGNISLDAAEQTYLVE